MIDYHEAPDMPTAESDAVADAVGEALSDMFGRPWWDATVADIYAEIGCTATVKGALAWLDEAGLQTTYNPELRVFVAHLAAEHRLTAARELVSAVERFRSGLDNVDDLSEAAAATARRHITKHCISREGLPFVY